MSLEGNFSIEIHQLSDIIAVLDMFKDNPEKVLNFSKLAGQWNLSGNDIDQIINLILDFQHLFVDTLDKYSLQKKWVNGTRYLSLVSRNDSPSSARKTIHLSTEESNMLSDITHFFQHVKIGKGFDVKTNGSNLTKKIKSLHKTHPYFFESRGNCLVYPSKLAIELGKSLFTLNKTNRTLSRYQVDEYDITIKRGE